MSTTTLTFGLASVFDEASAVTVVVVVRVGAGLEGCALEVSVSGV